MRPDERDLDEEIHGHLALEIRERIERGEDPDAARLAALSEFGYVPAIRDSMRRVWYSRWVDAAAALAQDIRIGLRSLLRTKGLAATIVITLALGIGANAAVFSVVRGVLLRPLVNRGEERLVYIRQSAPGLGVANTTFSVPEIEDFKSRATTISAFGDFSTIDFTMRGLGEPRVVQAGVVGGAYFDVMGLRPLLGRLLNAADDGPDAARVAVLTYGFWSTALGADPAVVGRTIHLGAHTATIVGVLEPSIPYPAKTEIIANVATSPHHLDATMVKGRTHRMTELFGRLAPGASIDDARAELRAVHAAILREHPDAYPASADMQLSMTALREQITAPARPVLLVLLAAAAVVFAIAWSNVANLILARSVRREVELAVRAALGASHAALRRTLLAESLVLCGGGAVLGVLIAQPLVTLVARFAARFSPRALDVTVDASLLWVGAGLAMLAAVLLAYVPRLPSACSPAGFGLTSGSVRLTPSTNRRLRAFAAAQIAFSFVLLAVAGTLLAALFTLQAAATGLNMRQVLVFDLPTSSIEIRNAEEMTFYESLARRVDDLPGVEDAAIGTFVPWRDAGSLPRLRFAAEGYTHGSDESPHARLRVVGPRYFALLGIPLLAGREFTAGDRAGSERVVIVSESVAARMFPDGDALNRTLWWTDPLFGKPLPRRIVGVVADVEDESIVQGPALTIYHPVQQMRAAGRLFVRASAGTDALVPEVTRVVRSAAPDQPIERGATLEDVRAEVLAPERLNAFVVSVFAAVALLISTVGVAGVLAFSVSARTREFGVLLAVGSTPRQLMMRVLSEGALIVMAGTIAGGALGYGMARVVARYLGTPLFPGALPILAAAAVLLTAAVAASLLPAARASRVDVLQALRQE